MSNRLRQRLEKAEKSIGDKEMSPSAICAARQRWEEFGELPENPKLREFVLMIDAAVAAMNASISGPPDPANAADVIPTP